jgi:hypothetical protein
MITLGSMAFCAYLVADESIPDADVPEDDEASAFVTSPDFHLAMVRAGGYSAQFDYPADGHYDASGIGRIQRRGAPSAICLSVPAAKDPSYRISVTNETPFAIIPGWLDGDGWKYAYETAYSNLSVAASNGVASLGVDVAGSSRQSLRLGCTASADGVELSDIARYEEGLIPYVNSHWPELRDRINSGEKLNREELARLKELIRSFTESFSA